MKKIILSAAVLFMSAASFAGTTWSVDNSHSNVKFSVTHLVVSEVEGSFKTYGGKVVANSDDFQNADIQFSVDVASINTDDVNRDGHLKGDDFFNAEKFPKMTFKSTSFKKVNGKNYVLEGDLTIRDVTKKVKFDVVYSGVMKDPYGNTKAGFKAKTQIKRFDYGLKWTAAVETGGLVVSNEVDITLNIELKKD
jgi:polyisoprenoid-binding protein YceI